MKPRLLDLFCGAGGCTKGYQDAGFYVVGVDINPQPRYVGDEFYQDDALEFVAKHGHEFDIIHASPPCQVHSSLAPFAADHHKDFLPQTIQALTKLGKPYIIENVPGAPLPNPLVLCGSMFALKVKRHRLFTTYPEIYWPPMPHTCRLFYTHSDHGQHSAFRNGATAISVAGNGYDYRDGCEAMDINWMKRKELSQAIPPAYTKWIGQQMIEMCFQ